jgi:hypothetical protein
MLEEWKTSDTQNNFLTTNLLKDKDLDNYLRDRLTIFGLKEVVYWPNFMTRRSYVGIL